MRAKGKTVLFIHHAGKNGTQRGNSKKEDVMDTVINLKNPSDYEPSEGACFEVHFEKARGLLGDDVKPFEARLTEDESGKYSWKTKTVEQSTYDKVVELTQDGLKQQDIAEMLSIHKSTVSRHVKSAKFNGDIHKGSPP